MGQIRIVRGDITKLSCDAIVNAANSSLLGGGGSLADRVLFGEREFGFAGEDYPEFISTPSSTR